MQGALRLFEELLPEQIRVLGSDNLEDAHQPREATSPTGRGEVGSTQREASRAMAARGTAARYDPRPGGRPSRHAHDAKQHRRLDGPGGRCEGASPAAVPGSAAGPHPRPLGPDHPQTLATRHNIAGCTGALGDAREALRLFRELLPDVIRVLGSNHPITQRTVEAVKRLEQQSQDRTDDKGTDGVIEASEQQSQDRTETPGSVSKSSWLERVKRFFRR